MRKTNFLLALGMIETFFFFGAGFALLGFWLSRNLARLS